MMRDDVLNIVAVRVPVWLCACQVQAKATMGQSREAWRTREEKTKQHIQQLLRDNENLRRAAGHLVGTSGHRNNAAHVSSRV